MNGIELLPAAGEDHQRIPGEDARIAAGNEGDIAAKHAADDGFLRQRGFPQLLSGSRRVARNLHLHDLDASVADRNHVGHFIDKSLLLNDACDAGDGAYHAVNAHLIKESGFVRIPQHRHGF